MEWVCGQPHTISNLDVKRLNYQKIIFKNY